MSIQKPFNINVNGSNLNGATVDVTVANIITWQASGDTSVSYDVQIYDNASGTLVFDSQNVQSYALQYTLAANSTNLRNGTTYKLTITVYNSSSQSATSNAVVFNTSATPIVTMNTISNPVASQTYQFSATYSQPQNSPMSSYIVYLYDNNNNVIAQSNVMTGTPIEYTFAGLQSGDSYKAEIQCTSFAGLTGTTGKISFNVNYAQPTVNLNLTATNLEDEGAIQLSWNVIQIIGQTDLTTVNYINNEEVDLTAGNNIWFQDGFSVDSNFTLKLWMNSPVHNVDLLTLTGENGTITLQYQDDSCFHLYKKIPNGNKTTHITTSVVQTSTQYPNYFILVQQIGNNCNIVAEVTA